MVPRTSAYRLRIRTDSADSNALMLLADSELVAILVELADDGHGVDQGRWVIETIFGFHRRGVPTSFASAEDAADWISDQFGHHRFVLGEMVTLLN